MRKSKLLTVLVAAAIGVSMVGCGSQRDSSRLSENTEDPRKFNIPWVFSFCQNLRICV